MNEYENKIEFIDYFNIIWKRKWIIITPVFLLVLAVGVITFLSPPAWEVETIIQPSKFFTQTQGGQFLEIVVVEPRQIVGQINEASYNYLIAAELNMDISNFPELKAENLTDTKLVRISTIVNDEEKGKLILYSLFNQLKRDLDKKIDIEIKGIDSQISTNENLIKQNKIKQNKIRQEILSAENKLKISKNWVNSIIEETKAVKERIDELEKQQRKALAEKKEGGDAVSLLLLSNQVQQNLQYYNTLDEKLNNEKIIQEDLKLNIERKKTEIENVNNEIENVKNQIGLLNEKKSRIDYAQFIKEPSSSLIPAKKKRNVILAGILGLMIFTMFAFFLEYIGKTKT